jgi:hypothetical protein
MHLRLRFVMLLARLLRIPIDVRQSYFVRGTNDTFRDLMRKAARR